MSLSAQMVFKCEDISDNHLVL